MQRRTAEKLGAAGAIGYAGLSFIGWLLFERFGAGNFEPRASAATMAHYFAAHHTELRISAACFCLALLGQMIFLARLRVVLSPPPDDPRGMAMVSSIFWGACIAGATIPFVFMTFFQVWALRPGGSDPGALRLAYDLCILTGPAGYGIWAAMFGSIAWLRLRGEGAHGLPRWLGVLAIAVAVFQFLYIGDGFSYQGLFDGTDGLLGVLLPYGSYLLWILVTGIVWARGVRVGAVPVPSSYARSAENEELSGSGGRIPARSALI
jgi:hypothetical protein